jgi:hypothetical protein
MLFATGDERNGAELHGSDAPQAPRYTSYARLQKAKNLDEVI